MSIPRVIDTVMFNRELDILECRLVEIGDSVDHMVIVEADIDHQGHPKPYHLSDNLDRFAAWKDKLVVVRATGLPSAEEFPDPWAREHAQREYVAEGLSWLDIHDDDVILHGDLDEIPTAVAARNVRPRGMVAFDMTCYSMAVDWQHPDRWRGTVAARAGAIKSFTQMRDTRNFAPAVPRSGWHLGWLGTTDDNLAKLGSFCHPEIAERTQAGLEADLFRTAGWHVDMRKLIPVDVDRSWPKWVRDGKCPQSWFRPRGVQVDWSPGGS